VGASSASAAAQPAALRADAETPGAPGCFLLPMLRRLSIAALVAAGALTATAQAAAPGDRDGRLAARDAWVKVMACSASEHNATFYARMARLARGQRLAMRFTLLELDEGGTYTPVRAPGLNRWRKSKPDVKAFAYRQKVRGLAADSAYRARVDYRWYAADGELTRRARRRSGICSQSPPKPNLRARIVGSAPTDLPGIRRYRVRLANPGTAAAIDAGVRLAVDGSSPETKWVPRIAAGAAAFVHFRAAQCAGSVRADADPDAEIAESSETDNSHQLACTALARR
jgi:hypothetical protein